MYVLPHQNAPVRGQAHGDAGKGVGGCQAPWGDFADGPVFLVGKPTAQAGMGCKVQELSSEKAELLAKSIDRQDHGRSLNTALCRRDVDALAVIDFGDSGVFIKRDVIRQAVGEATHQGSRVQKRSAIGEDGSLEMACPEPFGQSITFKPVEGLLEAFQLLDGGFKNFAHTLIGNRSVKLSILPPVAVDTMLVDLLFQMIDGGTRQCAVAVRLGQFLHRRADIMRQINGKACSPARSPFSDFLRIDQCNPITATVLGQTSCGCDARISGTEHDPVGLDIAFERRIWRANRQYLVPAIGVVVSGKDANRGHFT